MHLGDAFDGIKLNRTASSTERSAALALSAGLISVFALVWPRASMSVIEVPGFMPLFAGTMTVIDLVLAVLLFSKGAIGGQASPIRLGTAYLFSAMIIVPHVAAFPGAVMPQGLLGTSATAVWLWCFWHAGFAVAIMRHALARQSVPQPRAILRAVISTFAIVIALCAAVTFNRNALPTVLTGLAYQTNAFSLTLEGLVLTLNVVALALVGGRFRLRTAEDLWLTVAMLAACVDVALTFEAGQRFSLGWYAGRGANLVTSLVVLVSLFCDIMKVYGEVAQANLVLARLVHIDGLTGLANRRLLDGTLLVEGRRARRDQRPLSALMVDVDFFKRYNDTYGHQEGDRCLRAIAATLNASVQRPGDLVARYGGEEFALVLPSTDSRGALSVAETLRTAVRALGLPHKGSPLGVVTVSVGVASVAGDDAVDDVMVLADAALYRAKQAGRDRVYGTNVNRQDAASLAGSEQILADRVA